jgi:signal transduction histidine kinase
MGRRADSSKNSSSIALASPEDWLVGGGEMGKLIRSMDWSKSPLGPIESWPQSLRTTISLCLASNFPIALVWGPDHVQIYNDGYWPICGAKHPVSMGQDFTVCWAAPWPVIGDAFDRAAAGETSFLEDQRMFLDRNGYLEETCFTFSFSPIRDESGGVGGLFHPVTETTSRMLSERRTRGLRDLSASAGKAQTMKDACTLAAQTLATSEFDLPFVLLYLFDDADREARLSAICGLTPGTLASPEKVSLAPAASPSVWPLAQLARSSQPIHCKDLARRFGSLRIGPYPEPVKEALALPILPPGCSHPVGALIAGISSRLPLNDTYRAFFDMLVTHVTAAVANARSYQEERKRSEALAEIDRAKTAFFSNVSHEFRTPLTLMLGPLEDELAERSAPLPPARLERLQTAHRNSLRLLKLVNTLLDFSRIEAGRVQATYEATDLAVYTAELASVFRSAIEKAGITLTIDCRPLPELVHIDRDMWEKIVLNLLSNALKHTFQGGISVTLAWRADFVELQVADTGIGIPKSALPHVFERFHRVKDAKSRTHEGTGIGLALVQELTSLHGGSVSVASVENRGTTFTVTVTTGTAHLPADRIGSRHHLASTATHADAYVEEALHWLSNSPVGTVTSGTEPNSVALPSQNGNSSPGSGANLAAAVATTDAGLSRPSPATPASSPASASDTATRARILWADDNADMRDYVRRLLASRYDVVAVPDGLSAMAHALDSPPDLILTDVMMPGLDGFGLLAALRKDQRTHTIPVILLSARAGEESAVEGLNAGADDYLAKPFSAKELLARVRTHLELARLRREWARELEQANKELEAFSYSVSHDLRAPLRGIDGFSKALLENYGDRLDDQGRRYLDRVRAGAHKMSRLIDDMLHLSRIGRSPLHKEPVDLSSIALGIIADLREKDSARSVTVDIPDGISAVGDASLITIVLNNLLGNAWKFTAKHTDARISFEFRRVAAETVFAVSDNGAGFDMAYASKLFMPFHRLHRDSEFEGTGIGLATVHRLISRHGGRVWADSQPAKGATFFFTLGATS